MLSWSEELVESVVEAWGFGRLSEGIGFLGLRTGDGTSRAISTEKLPGYAASTTLNHTGRYI